MAKQIFIKFTIDGAIVQAESSAANIRQGDSNGEVSIIASVTGRTTAGYLARVHFERPDGKKANVVMTPSSEYSDRFVYVCESAWFFAVPGQAKATVTITDSGGAVSAQGTYEFAVAATTVDVIDSTLTYDEAAALEGLIADMSAQVAAVSKLTSNPVTVAYSLTRNAFRTVLSGYTAEAFGDLGGYIIKKNGASLTEQDVLEYMSVMFGTETVPFGTPTNESGRQAILFLQNGEMYRIIYSTSGGIYDLYALRLSCSAAKLREELGQSIFTAALTAGGQNTKIAANDNEVEIIDATTKDGLHVGGGFIYFVSLDNKYFLPNNAGGASSDAFILASKAYADSAAATVRSALQAEIDTVNAIQNVVDIVGTKAALLAYVTTDLHSGDKIEVLVDESQSNANTIYSWTGSAWVLIGSKAPYYSISQIDSMLLSYATASWVDSNYMSLTKGGVVDLEEDPASANTFYFGAKHGTKSYHQISDNAYAYRVSDGDGNLVQHNANKNGMVTWLKTANGASTITKVPFKPTAGTHDLAFQEDLDAANAKIAKQESDIQYLYRQVIGGGDLVTETDSGVALTSQPFPLTVSPKALLDYVGGMCQKVNQHRRVAYGSVDESTGQYRVLGKEESIGLVYGHKYFVSFNAVIESDNTTTLRFKLGASGYSQFLANVSNGLNQQIGELTTASGPAEDSSFFMTYDSGYTHFSYSNLRIVDLTAIYGAGNEPTSASDARIQWLMSYLSSHPEYDAGSILTAPVTKVVSKGFNLWDEEWEVGVLNTITGAPQGSQGIRSKNYISVLPNTTYYGNDSNSAANLWLMFFDKDKNVIVPNNSEIGGTSTYENAVSADMHTFTTPSNCRYIKLYMSQSYGTTYNHDICINVSNATMNGTYMPYRAPIEYPIPAEVRALEGYGYGIDADYTNHIDFDRKKFVKVVKRVNLGSLDYVSNNAYPNIYYAPLDMRLNDRAEVIGLCEGYTRTTYVGVNNMSSLSPDKSFMVRPEGDYVYFKDTAYATKEEFKQAVQGKYFYYEALVPVETDISEYIDSDVIEVTAGGHLEFENENDVGVPYSATYQCEANP